MQPSPQTPNKRPFWQFLLPPMLLLSLGLHGLVLFTPIAPSEDDLVPPPDPEEDGIAITKIDAPTPRTSRAQSPTAATTAAPGSPRPTAGRPASASTSQAQTSNAQTSRPATNNTANRGSQGGRTSQSANASRSPSGGTSNRAATPQNSRNPSAQNPQNAGNAASQPSVRNPNPSAPPVESPTQTAFEEYVEVFSGYLGLKTISEAEAETFKEQWLSSFTEEGGAYSNLGIQPLNGLDKVPYEAKICLPSAPDPAQILALVEADGSLNEFTRVVQSTGYRSFDETANSVLQKHTFPSAEAPQAYLVEIEVEYDPENCEWPPKLDKLPNDYFALLQNYIGPDLTTQAEFNAAKDAWLTGLSQAEASELAGEESLEAAEFAEFDGAVEYPLNICLPIPPKDAEWGVVVGPDGTLQGELEPLRSTGYSDFDERSKELITGFDFPEAETTQLYIVEVPVDYNPLLCQALDSEEFTVSPAVASVSGSDTTTDAGTSSETDEEGSDRPSQNNSPDALAFNPSRQEALRTTGQQSLNASEFGRVNSDPGLLAGLIESGWPEGIAREAFLSELDAENGLTPADGAVDAFVLTRNADIAPDSLSELYGVESRLASEEYQGAPLYELSEDGVPQFFASVVGIGVGDSSALVVLWSADPRQTTEATPNSPSSAPAAAPETPSPVEDTPETPPQPESESSPSINPRGLGMLLLDAFSHL